MNYVLVGSDATVMNRKCKNPCIYRKDKDKDQQSYCFSQGDQKVQCLEIPTKPPVVTLAEPSTPHVIGIALTKAEINITILKKILNLLSRFAFRVTTNSSSIKPPLCSNVLMDLKQMASCLTENNLNYNLTHAHQKAKSLTVENSPTCSEDESESMRSLLKEATDKATHIIEKTSSNAAQVILNNTVPSIIKALTSLFTKTFPSSSTTSPLSSSTAPTAQELLSCKSLAYSMALAKRSTRVEKEQEKTTEFCSAGKLELIYYSKLKKIILHVVK